MELKFARKLKLRIPEPFDFHLTVAKPAGCHWSTPEEVFDREMLWTGIYLRDMLIGLKMAAGNGPVLLDIFSEIPLTSKDLEVIRQIVLAGLGAGEDLAGFYRFCAPDPVLSRVVADLPGMRIGFVDNIFGSTILAILLQMAPIARSEQMTDAVLDLFGTKITFDGKDVPLWPPAQVIADADPGLLRKKAMLGYRADRLIRAAQYLKKNPLSLRNYSGFPGGNRSGS